MNTLLFLVFYFIFNTPGYTAPSVTLTSCKANTATVTVTDVEEGFILFFRTDTAYNMITTPGGTVVHACAFDECNIQWNEKFYIVIQKTIIYQTSEDSVVWLVCTSDSNSINAIKFEFSSFQVVENLTTKTYKPEVAMSFYKEDIRLDSRAEVKLGDNIQMIIRVTNNANDYFDISAKSCFASGITLIEDRCPVSDDLFNVFNATAVGYLSNTFSMFRPTSISGGPYEVVFTCILEVCLWNCDEYDCSSGETSSSSIRRKKRNADVRPADGQSNPSVVRGFTLTAVAEGEEIEVKNEKPSFDDLCVPVSVIATLAGMFVFVVGSSSAITSISYNYYCSYTKSILVMKEQKDGDDKKVFTEPKSVSEEPIDEQNVCNVALDNSEITENDDGRKDSDTNRMHTSCGEMSKQDKYMQELKAQLQARTDNQRPYRRKSIPIAGITSSPEHKSVSYT